MKCKINKLMIWAIWLQNLMFRHTTDEFLTDRGIYPFFVPAITTGSFTGGVSGSVFTCS